jgi:hypothetical protein
MIARLSDEQRRAVDESNGCVPVDGGGYVVMTMQVFREIMGIGTDEEFAASVATLRKSMDEVRQGKTRPLTEALDELGRKHEA